MRRGKYSCDSKLKTIPATTRAGTNNRHITAAYQSQVSYQDGVLVDYQVIEKNLFWYFVGIDEIPQRVIGLVLRTASGIIQLWKNHYLYGKIADYY